MAMTGGEHMSADAVGIVTYSSAKRPGEPLQATRTSLIAAYGAQEVMQNPDCPYYGTVVIAAEQSYRVYPESTGHLLVADPRLSLAEGRQVEVITPARNRLLNTALQMAALARYSAERDLKSLHLFGWGFHEARVRTLFEARSDVALSYTAVEDVLRTMDQRKLNKFLGSIGMTVEFEDIMQRGIKTYAEREVGTSKVLLLGKSGWGYNFMTGVTGLGRYDDLNPDGTARKGKAWSPRTDDALSEVAFVD